MHPIQKLFSVGAILIALPACTTDVAEPGAELSKDGETKEGVAWSTSDDPSIFGPNLKYKVAELPQTGEAQNVPWAASYWPYYEDSINHKWAGAGTDAPSTKYGKAFNVTGVEDAVSKMRGVDSATTRTKCTETSQCKSELGEQCAKRDGKTEGYCIPNWWGICHAWAPASILVPEPKNEVVYNGVTFKVNDIKALVTLAFDSTVTKFASLRCDQDDRDGKIQYDEHGRPKEGDCIDTNPGTFHILLGNYVGLQKGSFVYDQTFDDEVWNQPLRGYRVKELTEIDWKEANRRIGVTTTGGTTKNLNATIAAQTWKHFEAIAVQAGKPVKVAMSGTGDGDLHVRFGAQATASTYDCRPYEDGSVETCDLTAPAGATQVFVSVHGYAASTVDLVVTTGGVEATKYAFNDKAVKFWYAKTEVDHIGESASNVDGNLAGQIDRYTATNVYEYVLEADADGRILGGEWLNGSKRSHPDFVWLPLRNRLDSVASGKIEYAKVKMLLDLSLGGNEGGTGAQKTVDETGTVAKGAFKHYGPFKVATGTSLVATLSGDGDADLYVRKGAAPTLTAYDCRPYKDGSAETCTVAGPGDVYVSVNGYATTSSFQLKVVYTEASSGGGPPPPPPPPAATHLDVSGSVTLGEMKVFELSVVAGKKVVIRTTAPKDVDVYVQTGSAPTTSSYAAQAYTSSGDETLTFVPSTSGKLFVGVHGYEASTFTLKTADN